MRKPEALLAVVGPVLAVCLSLAAAPGTAAAEPIVYAWTGTVTSIGEPLLAASPSFQVGDPVIFTASIDDGVVGQPLSSGGATTYNPIDTTTFSVGDGIAISGGQFDFVGSITVQDSTTDAFRIDRQALPSASLPPDLGIYRFYQWIAVLRDASGSAFSDQSLPTSLALEDFSSTELTLIYRNPDEFSDSTGVGIRVEDVSVMVPEPRAMALLTMLLAVAPLIRRAGC